MSKIGDLSMTNEAIDAMDQFVQDMLADKVGGRADYMAAFERIVAAGAYFDRSKEISEILSLIDDLSRVAPHANPHHLQKVVESIKARVSALGPFVVAPKCCSEFDTPRCQQYERALRSISDYSPVSRIQPVLIAREALAEQKEGLRGEIHLTEFLGVPGMRVEDDEHTPDNHEKGDVDGLCSMEVRYYDGSSDDPHPWLEIKLEEIVTYPESERTYSRSITTMLHRHGIDALQRLLAGWHPPEKP